MGRKDRAREPVRSSPGGSEANLELAELLDEALAQLNNGDDLEEILACYPAHASVLEPVLRAAHSVRHTPPPVPSASARQAGLDRLLNAVSQQREAAVEVALDAAIARLRAGETPATILADYPDFADALQPLLNVAATIIDSPQPVADSERRMVGRERLLRAVGERRAAKAASIAPMAPQAAPVGGLFEDALDNALRWLADGVDIDTVLRRHPVFAARMRPLLETAQQVRQVPEPVPDEDAYFAGRKRVVQLAAVRRRERRAAQKQRSTRGIDRWADVLAGLLGFAPRFRRVAMTAALLVLMVIGSFSVTQVAADSLPSSPLYPVKRLGERVQLAMTSSPEAKTKLHLRFSQERLRETERLARESGQSSAEVLNEMLEHNDQFLGSIKYLSEDQQRQLLADGASVFYQQRRVLTDLSEQESLLSPSERLALREYVGETGDDQAIAEEVQRDLDLATYIPTPAAQRPAVRTATPTAVLQPSPTLVPTEVQVKEPVRPTAEPATPVPAPTDTVAPTPVPPTPTDEPEVIMGPADPLQPESPTATATSAPTATPEPTQAPTQPPSDPGDDPTPEPEPTEPPAAPTPEPEPTEPPDDPTPEPEPTDPPQVVLPTLPPPPEPTP